MIFSKVNKLSPACDFIRVIRYAVVYRVVGCHQSRHQRLKTLRIIDGPSLLEIVECCT